MARNYRTAQGKVLDMSALATKHERSRAVGNMSVNARGDTIDSDGKIVVPVTQKVGKAYGKTVGNKSANAKSVPVVQTVERVNPVEQFEKSQEEKELESLQEDDLEIEAIKTKENESK